MKKLILVSLLSLGLAAGVQAQERTMEYGKPDGTRIAKHLDISESQMPAFQEVMKEQFEQRRALHQDFRKKNQALEGETRAKLEGVLTPEQLEKLDAMKEKRQHKWQRHSKRSDHKLRHRASDDVATE